TALVDKKFSHIPPFLLPEAKDTQVKEKEILKKASKEKLLQAIIFMKMLDPTYNEKDAVSTLLKGDGEARVKAINALRLRYEEVYANLIEKNKSLVEQVIPFYQEVMRAVTEKDIKMVSD